MKIQYLIIIWVTSILLLLVVVIPVTGQSDIVTNGADTVRPISVTSSLDLNNLLGGVAVRNVVESANTVRQINLAALSGDLQNVLANVSARIVFQSANTNRLLALAYPKMLLNDIVAPVITKFTHAFDGNKAKVTWDTNEFALCILHYGTQPGSYTDTVDDPLYRKQHEASLADATAGTTFYTQITCTDQSDNVVNSTEFSFAIVTTRPLFLPLIRR